MELAQYRKFPPDTLFPLERLGGHFEKSSRIVNRETSMELQVLHKPQKAQAFKCLWKLLAGVAQDVLSGQMPPYNPRRFTSR